MIGLGLLVTTLVAIAVAFSMGGMAVLVRRQSALSVGAAFAWGVVLGPLGVAIAASVGRNHTIRSPDPPMSSMSSRPFDKN